MQRVRSSLARSLTRPLEWPALTGAAAASLLVALGVAIRPAGAEEPGPAPVPPQQTTEAPAEPPHIQVVFAVDTTGSMGGLIAGAKRKVWSIANEILSGDPRPRLSVGLIAYRDRGDEYVTRVTQPSEDLDTIYQALMGFQAGGGGDGPEHVNRALNDAFHAIQWDPQARLRLVYLVGDAPAHRDYDQELDYAKIVPAARADGVLCNVVLCGADGSARAQFQEIARLGGGEFFQIDQSGGMTAVATPYDARLQELQRELEQSRVFYGRRDERKKAEEARERVLGLEGEAAASRASAMTKAAAGAPAPAAAACDAVEAYERGALNDVAADELPDELRSLSDAERQAKLEELSTKRQALESELANLAKQRDGFLKDNAPRDGFDSKVTEALRRQAAEVGVTYK